MNMNNAGDLYEDIFINNRLVNIQNTMNYMYAKVTEIFRYNGLPLTLPKRIIEAAVTRGGGAVVYEYEGNLFVTETVPGTKTNLYQENTEVTFEHRVGATRERLTRTVGIDAVLIRNDSLMIGLDPIITEYAIMSAQAKITMIRNLVDLRGNYIIQAKDENAYKSALEYENAIRRGDTAIIMAEEFDAMEGIIVHSTPISNSPATQTIELYQYIQSLYYSELGIDLNNNMKRAYVNENEIEKSSGMPLIHNMLNCRQEAVRDIKALFGVDITVSLSSEWEEQEEEQENESQVGSEGAESDEVTVNVESDEGSSEGSSEEVTEGSEQDSEEDSSEEGNSEEDGDEEDPELEEVTEAELVEATEALIGEVNDGEADNDSSTGDSSSESDSSSDEGKRSEMATEEDDDEE